MPGCPTAGCSLHSDVPTAPHVILSPPGPPTMLPNPMERTVTHSPGTPIGNPGLCPSPVLHCIQPVLSSCHIYLLNPSQSYPVSPSTLLTLHFWPLSSLTWVTALSRTIISRKQTLNTSSLCLRAFSCLSPALEPVQTPHPGI